MGIDMETAGVIVTTWVLPITAGIVLAAAAGLRAFLPLTAVAWAAHFDLFQVHPSFAWIGSVPAVLVFTAAVVFEIGGDKVPAIDHFLDSIQVFVKPVAGALVVAAPLVSLDPLYAVVLGIATGGVLAEGVHLLKAKGRILGNVLTFGLAAPVLSLAEDVVAVVLVGLAVLVPLVALLLAASVVTILLALRRRKAPEPISRSF